LVGEEGREKLWQREKKERGKVWEGEEEERKQGRGRRKR
jgi:hypothetical protein